jgi:hypothetical protein
VHSPFAYALITQVIGEQSPFYDYDTILRLRQQYSPLISHLPKFVSRRMMSTKLLFLLYRLVNRFNPEHILELENQGGLVSYVLGMPNTKSEVISIGTDLEQIEQTNRLRNQEEPHNMRLIHSSLTEGLRKLPENYKADFVFIHRSACVDSEALYEAVIPRLQTHTVVVVEGINADRQARKMWNFFRYSSAVRVSMDLYEMGIAIYDDQLFKQHYIVSF